MIQTLNQRTKPIESVPPAKRACVRNVITPELAAALDRTKTSSRNVSFFLAGTASSLGHNIEELNINPRSLSTSSFSRSFST